MKYMNIDSNVFNMLKSQIGILFVTATDVETKVLHNSFQAINIPYNEILVYNYKNITIYIGNFENYLVSHIQCGMGAVQRSGSILSTQVALEILDIQAVIMPGICFGIDKKIQKIGDVLISQNIALYDVSKINKHIIEYRGCVPESGPILFNRFKAHHVTNQHNFKTFYGTILSGEKLVNDIDFRNSLKKQYPTAIGGEMEGAGIYATTSLAGVEWIIVKGICDWGDGKKNKKSQENAALNSIKLCSSVLLNDCLFDLNIKKYNCVNYRSRYIQGIQAHIVKTQDEISTIINNISKHLEFDISLFKYLIGELWMNSVTHGKANKCMLEVCHNKISLIDDGKNFDLQNYSPNSNEDEYRGVGKKILMTFLKTYKTSVSYDYSIIEGLNYHVFKFEKEIDGGHYCTLKVLPNFEDCSEVMEDIKREILSKIEKCPKLVVDLSNIHIYSIGIGMVVGILKIIRNIDNICIEFIFHRGIKKLWEITGLERVFESKEFVDKIKMTYVDTEY